MPITVTQGSDFEVVHMDRSYGGKTTTILKIAGKDGKITVNGLPFVPGVPSFDQLVPEEGQTVIALTARPRGLVQLFVNGQRQFLGLDFVINGSVITWLNNHFVLSASDVVHVEYDRDP